MRALICFLAACATASPAYAAPPKVRALADIHKAGFKDCIEPMARFVTFVHDDDDAYAYLGVWSQEKPNTEMATVLTSEGYTDGHSLATITAVKTANGACNVTLTQAFVTPEQTCPRVRDESFKEWKFYSELNGATLYEDPTTPNGNVAMTPVGKTGCLIVKNLVAFE
jgi:hypothetical protein